MAQWHKAAALADLWEGAAFPVDVAGKALALYRVGAEVLAAGDWCPHQAGVRLSEGFVDGETIECPMHQSCFNLRTGEVLGPPATCDIPVYPVRIDGAEVYVDLGE